MGEASLGARLLTTEKHDKAREIAQHLDALNRERQAIEQAVLEEGHRAGRVAKLAARLRSRPWSSPMKSAGMLA